MRPVRSVFFALVLWALPVGIAADLIVHPFASPDPVVGMALADRVAEALGGIAVIDPTVAPLAVPPIVVPGGFLNPFAVQAGGVVDRTGVALLAGALGVPNAVAGEVVFDRRGLRLELVAAIDGSLRSATVRGVASDLGSLTLGATAVVAAWVGATADPPRALDLTGTDRDVAQARVLVGAGLAAEAAQRLATLPDLAPRDAAFRADLSAALQGSSAAPPLLAAMVAITGGAQDATPALARWRAETGLGIADVWLGAYAHARGDQAAADAAFARGADYPFGAAARAAYRGVAQGASAAIDDLAALATSDDPAALLAAALAAGALEDAAVEARLLTALATAAPFMPYPFERLSFLAFDRDDPLAAARALAVALDLEPESDLYWTNYGWALYLLGSLAESERASLTALAFDPSQVIARYNLGLVRVVTGRLDEALADYRAALSVESDVDAEAIADLVAAEGLYPDVIGVPYALAFLLDRAGERQRAAEAYERFAARAGDVDPPRAREAAGRAAALRAPLPPIEIVDALAVTLGRRGPAVDAARPGDPLTVAFEVTTPGDALPRALDLRVTVVAGADEVAATEARIDVPSGAIGFVIDTLTIELPIDLPAREYTLVVDAAGDGLAASATRALAVEGARDDLRRLVGRGVSFTALEGGRALLSARDLEASAATLWQRLADELRAAAPLAEEALDPPATGRFAGMTGGAIFAATTPDDVRAFVAYLLEAGVRDAVVPLADAYAEWVLDGAPEPVR